MAKKSNATTADQGTTAAETAKNAVIATLTAMGELRHIPMALIFVERQIRTGVDIDDEKNQGFVGSVAEHGVIEPILVAPQEDLFRLLAGELRYRAALKLGLPTIPAIILPNVKTWEDTLRIQVTENFQRRELDPIDKANAILAFFQCRHEGMDLDGVINCLILCDRADQRVPDEVVATVATISKISGMKTRTLQNIILLLRLPEEIKDAVRTEAVSVSQGYILAANLDNPGLMTVFESILEHPVTNDRLKELLKKTAQADATAPADPPSPFQPIYTAGQALTKRLEDGKVRYDLIELENLRLFFLSMAEMLDRAKAGGGTLKEPDPSAGGKKKRIA